MYEAVLLGRAVAERLEGLELGAPEDVVVAGLGAGHAAVLVARRVAAEVLGQGRPPLVRGADEAQEHLLAHLRVAEQRAERLPPRNKG